MKSQVLSIAICDDEVQIGKLIEKKFLEYAIRHNIEYQIQVFHDGQSLLQHLKEKTDLLFLDIEMPGLNGIETAAELRKKNKDIKIIFLSAYREYVFESFKVRTFRYLLKPLKDEDFEEVMDELMHQDEEENYLVYSFRGAHYSISYNDILYIEGMRGKIVIHCTNGEYRWRGALSMIYEEMNMKLYHMFQIHQSFIVNMDKIIHYNSKEVVLDGNRVVPISKHRLDDFKKEYIRLWGDSLF